VRDGFNLCHRAFLYGRFHRYTQGKGEGNSEVKNVSVSDGTVNDTVESPVSDEEWRDKADTDRQIV